MSALGLLNFVVLQWFGLRLGRVEARELMGEHPSCFRPLGWTIIRWVWPLTGWWSPYRWIARRAQPLFWRGRR